MTIKFFFNINKNYSSTILLNFILIFFIAINVYNIFVINSIFSKNSNTNLSSVLLNIQGEKLLLTDIFNN